MLLMLGQSACCRFGCQRGGTVGPVRFLVVGHVDLVLWVLVFGESGDGLLILDLGSLSVCNARAALVPWTFLSVDTWETEAFEVSGKSGFADSVG